MKLKFIIFSILIATSLRSSAQEPPKKANKIIVLAKDSANTLMNKIVLALYDHGFTLDQKDEQIKIIITRERPSPRYGTMSKIKVKIVDTAIVFSSMIAINSDRDILGVKEAAKTFYDVDYSGSKRSAMREAWNEMDAIAKLFGDKKIYSK